MTHTDPGTGTTDQDVFAQGLFTLLRANKDGQPCTVRRYGHTVEAGPLTIRFVKRTAQVTFTDPWTLNDTNETVIVTVSGAWSCETLALLVEGLLCQLAVTP